MMSSTLSMKYCITIPVIAYISFSYVTWMSAPEHMEATHACQQQIDSMSSAKPNPAVMQYTSKYTYLGDFIPALF